MYYVITYLNFLISLFGLWSTVSRIFDGLYLLNKFSGYDSSNVSATIGAYTTTSVFNIIFFGSLTSIYLLIHFNQKNKLIHLATLLSYTIILILIDISLCFNIFSFVNIR